MNLLEFMVKLDILYCIEAKYMISFTVRLDILFQ